MACTGFTMAVIALVAVGGAGYARAQTSAAAQAKTAQKQPAAAKDAGEKKGTAGAKLQLKDLPPAVRATVEAETRNATLESLAREKENGKTVYEVESMVNGRSRDLMVDAAGEIYEVEERIDAAKAPAPVKAALEAKGRIVVLESVTTNGTVHYEGQVETKAGRKLSLDLDAAGKPIRK